MVKPRLLYPTYREEWGEDSVVFYREHQKDAFGPVHGSASWRWRRVAKNGRIVGASSKGYRSLKHCEENAARLNWDVLLAACKRGDDDNQWMIVS